MGPMLPAWAKMCSGVVACCEAVMLQTAKHFAHLNLVVSAGRSRMIEQCGHLMRTYCKGMGGGAQGGWGSAAARRGRQLPIAGPARGTPALAHAGAVSRPTLAAFEASFTSSFRYQCLNSGSDTRASSAGVSVFTVADAPQPIPLWAPGVGPTRSWDQVPNRFGGYEKENLQG